MKITADEKIKLEDGTEIDSGSVGIFDVAGNMVGLVMSFDTETCEMERYLPLGPKDSNGLQLALVKAEGDLYKPAIVKFTLPGAYVKLPNGEILK